MRKSNTVNLGNMLLSFSDAMDMVKASLAQHQLRTAYICWTMGRAARFERERQERLFLAALLHDIGALSVEEKLALHEFESADLDPHCIRGHRLLGSIPRTAEAAEIVLYHHRQWKHWDRPLEDPTAMDSQIILIADLVERWVDRERFILHQQKELLGRVRETADETCHREIVELCCEAASREEFWLDLVSPRLYALLLHEGPFRNLEIEVSEVPAITELFRYLIDFRSPFTATHSSGVATCAEMLARKFGFTDREVQLIRVAGDLHDLGKLAIPNRILNKPGALSREEYAVIRSHPYFTYSLLGTIQGLRQITEWAAFHHERLDGTGYPFRCTADDLSIGSRILAVADLFTAIAERRPYREGMSQKQIHRLLHQAAKRGHIDASIVELLHRHHDEIHARVAAAQASASEFYERQFST